jgi:hypothetical protein
MTEKHLAAWTAGCVLGLLVLVAPSLQESQQQQNSAAAAAASPSEQQLLDEDKRAWGDLQGGWGKRGWQDLQVKFED